MKLIAVILCDIVKSLENYVKSMGEIWEKQRMISKYFWQKL